MSIRRIDLSNVRNIAEVSISPSQGINLLFGCNGSGKSSFLEAIHLLAVGRSFRTNRIQKVVSAGAATLLVFAEYLDHASNIVSLGVERGSDIKRLRIGGRNVPSIAEFARVIPLQLINPDSHRLVDQGARYRRQFVDWGVFHVEPEFLPVWGRFRRTLGQRNAALRGGTESDAVISVWHNELAECAERIAELRDCYVSDLSPIAGRYVKALMNRSDIEISLQRGWNAGEEYESYLNRSLQADRKAGFTQRGPHRASLQITLNGVMVQDRLSRGEQKLLASALRLAQIDLFSLKTGRRCVVLVDDLPSELDERNREKFMHYLHRLRCQVFVTATARKQIPEDAAPIERVFHVEHGKIQEVV